MPAKNINGTAEKFFTKTLWIWFPFAVLKILIQDVIAKNESKRSSDDF